MVLGLLVWFVKLLLLFSSFHISSFCWLIYCIKHDWFHPTYPSFICLSHEMHFYYSIMKEIIFLLPLCTALLYMFSVVLVWLLWVDFFLEVCLFLHQFWKITLLDIALLVLRHYLSGLEIELLLLFWHLIMLLRHVLLFWYVCLCRQIDYFSLQPLILFLCFTILSPFLRYDFKRLFSQILNVSCY